MKWTTTVRWGLTITILSLLLQSLDAEAHLAERVDAMGKETFDTVLLCVKAGISVIPVRADGSKAPAISSWKPYMQKIAAQHELQEMFPPGEKRGVAAVCGKVSRDLEVLDFDEPSMHEKFRMLLQQERGDQALFDKLTVLVETPSGGHHLFYRCPDGVKGGQKLAQRLVANPDGISKTITLIETRGEGNYVVLPGSPITCHSAGKPYQLLRGDLTQIPAITGAERELLLHTARRLDEIDPKSPVARKPSTNQCNRPGDHFNRDMKWGDILEPHGWEVKSKKGDETYWRRPDKDHNGISATTNHEGSDLLHVFSTNAYPFEAGHNYNKYGAYALLNHGGDFKAAAAAISSGKGKKGQTAGNSSGEVDHVEGSEPEEKSQADRLLNLALKSGIMLFHDQFKRSHGLIRMEGHHEIWPLRGQQFKLFLSRRGWQTDNHAFSNDAIGAALNVLDSIARFEGQEIPLHNRVAYHEGSIYYDFSDREWRAIKISESGWEIVNNAPILFRRYAHQSAQVEPQNGGKLEDVLQFLNLGTDQDKLLLLTYTVAALVPDIPHPVLLVHGPQGATKTTLLRILRRLIDPSQTQTLTISTDLREFVQLLSHHWSAFFDNVSSLTDWMSDAMCRAATGDAFSKRELYSDDEDFIYEFRRCVALNGINIAAHKPDLLDRSILIGLQSIAPSQRREERKFWKEFEEARPLLFGAMLTALSRAMELLPSIKPAGLPRMADFAVWGCAIAKALGYSSDDFLTALNANSEVRNDEALSSSPIASAIMQFIATRGAWEGSPTVLLDKLSEIAGERQSKAREWPKAPHILTRRMKEIIPNLALLGIELEIGGRTRESRRITIRKRQTPDVTNVTTSREPAPSHPDVSSTWGGCDANDASDATPGSSGCQETSSSSHILPESPSDKRRRKGGR